MVGQWRLSRIFIYAIWIWLLATSVWTGPADAKDWQSLTTKHTVLRFQSDEDLIEFDSQIDYGSSGGLGSLFGSSDKKNNREKLVQKIDALYKRVQEILDMRKFIRPVTINIYPDTDALQAAYRELFKGNAQLRAWYLFEKNTIYLQIGDINEGMLAHELAHAIIDNFLQVRPPAASAEILARYVDAHLLD